MTGDTAMKRTVITGGTRGIGFGVASHLAREGFDLAVCGVRAESSTARGVGEDERLVGG